MKKGAFNQENLCFFSPSTQKKKRIQWPKEKSLCLYPKQIRKNFGSQNFFSRSHPPKIDFNSRFKKRCYFPLFAAM